MRRFGRATCSNVGQQDPVAAVAPVVAPVVAADAADAPDANANVAAPPARSGLKKKAFIIVSKDNCDEKFWPEMVFHSMHKLTPEAMFTYFRETLDGDAKDQWDVEMEGADSWSIGTHQTYQTKLGQMRTFEHILGVRILSDPRLSRPPGSPEIALMWTYQLSSLQRSSSARYQRLPPLERPMTAFGTIRQLRSAASL